MLVAILFILGLIFLFAVPPLGIILLILAVIGLFLKLIKGTGKAVINTGKFVNKLATEKTCPYCYSKIDSRATVCAVCTKDLLNSEVAETTQNEVASARHDQGDTCVCGYFVEEGSTYCTNCGEKVRNV